MRFSMVVLLAFGLGGCATVSGDPSANFVNPEVARAYIPLEGRSYVVMENRAAAFLLAPGIAVTNAHNSDFLGDVPVIGASRNFDLLYFRVSRTASPVYGAPALGEQVVAYGQGPHGEVREAHGVVRQLNRAVEARCETCIVQGAFVYEGNAGPGFSGGPVVDAISGAIVGITFGYNDENGHRLMYAYPISRARNELAVIEGRLPDALDANGTR
jgi:S1-C subfamily serine protease